MKRVFLIDSMSHIFRAFFAPMGMRQEPMHNSKGQVTQAVFVFTNMLRKLLNDEKPDYVAAVFDTAAPTFRPDSFEAYKANREAPPPELLPQFAMARQVVDAFGLASVEVDGWEADDVIATLATRALTKKQRVVIVSSDKDLMQLLGDEVRMVRPVWQGGPRGAMQDKGYGPAEVVERYGVPPAQLGDVLALMGDTSDNIPGVKGIGEKGVKTLRGVVVHQHGCGEGSCKSGLTGAFDLHWQSLAKKHGCALLAPSYEQPEKADCQMWCDPRNGSDEAFRKCLVDLGRLRLWVGGDGDRCCDAPRAPWRRARGSSSPASPSCRRSTSAPSSPTPTRPIRSPPTATSPRVPRRSSSPPRRRMRTSRLSWA